MKFTPEYAATFANTPSGQSTAAAIVTSCLFFMFLVIMLPSYIISKYPYYDVLAISCIFRSIGYASRAAYLGGTYRPALQGVYLAFANAGYGVSIAVLTLGIGSWFNRVDRLYFPLWLHQTLRTIHFLLIIPVIAFGPINGVVAAGLLFGDYNHLGSWINGFKCRRATTWGLWGVNTTVLLMASFETMVVLLKKAQPKAAKFMVDQGHPQRKPKLFAIFLVCAVLMELRGTFNLIADYKENYFLDDKLWYPLNPLWELMGLAILCFPLLFARMAQAWPKSEPKEGSKADNNKNNSDQVDGKNELSNGTVKTSAPGSQGSSLV